jgi:hypothetical protein
MKSLLVIFCLWLSIPLIAQSSESLIIGVEVSIAKKHHIITVLNGNGLINKMEYDGKFPLTDFEIELANQIEDALSSGYILMDVDKYTWYVGAASEVYYSRYVFGKD